MSLHVFDPLDGLALRVHHEWPAIACGHHHTILSGEGVRGKSLDVPVSDGRWLSQESSKGEVWSARNVELTNLKVKISELIRCPLFTVFITLLTFGNYYIEFITLMTIGIEVEYRIYYTMILWVIRYVHNTVLYLFEPSVLHQFITIYG